MKSVNKYLEKADKAIKDSNIAEKNKIPKAYKGAVSSFGASIIMSGLVPTIQFYMADSERRDSDSKKIVEAIARIIYSESTHFAEKLKDDVMSKINNRAELNSLKKKIIDAAIALKIMMRSYHFSEDVVVTEEPS
jgi:CRISPR-associated protein Cmr5